MESDDASEIAHYVRRIMEDAELRKSIREAARQTASKYTWDKIVVELLTKLEYIAMKNDVSDERSESANGGEGGGGRPFIVE